MPEGGAVGVAVASSKWEWIIAQFLIRHMETEQRIKRLQVNRVTDSH